MVINNNSISYQFFSSFDNSGSCPTSAWTSCFDVSFGTTTGFAQNQSCSYFTNINGVRGIVLKVHNSPSNPYAGNSYLVSFCDTNGDLLRNSSKFTSLPGNGFFSLPILIVWNLDGVNNRIEISIEEL
ncbi:MAG: hypothetical protein H6909_05320 [Rickettsiaceae bacterium]|nr:hypothetical protein [Rickettsiaceae bacterium]